MAGEWRLHRDGEVWVKDLEGFLSRVEVEVIRVGELYRVAVRLGFHAFRRELFEGDLEGAKARALELAKEAA